MSCSPGTLQSFPVNLSITVNPQVYTGVLEPLNFEFQWSSRSTAPQFVSSQNGTLDEPTTTSIRYSGTTYNLVSVQITDPTHKSWISSSSARAQNFEDIILTFSSGLDLTDGVSEYITIIVPILRVPSGPNVYLEALGTTSTGTISLKSVVPSAVNSMFAYYSTCATGTNFLNIVAVDGLPVTNTTMVRIKTVYNNMNASSLQTYGPYINPITSVYAQSTAHIIASPPEFNMHVGMTQNILAPSTATATPSVTAEKVEEATDAYKCVPFDPDTQILDGKIVIDSSSGTPLSQIQAERASLVPDSKPIITADIYKRYVSVALATFFSISIVIIIIYVSASALIGPRAVGHGAGYFQQTYSRMTNVPTYLTIAILCGFTGFMAGMVLRQR